MYNKCTIWHKGLDSLVVELELPLEDLDSGLLAETPQQAGLVHGELLHQRVQVVVDQAPAVVGIGLLPHLDPETPGAETRPLHTVRWREGRLLDRLLGLVPARSRDQGVRNKEKGAAPGP